MGWTPPEEKIARGIRVLVIASGMASAVISLLYILASIMPLWYFHGYVRGYYSLLNYRLYYSHNWQQIPMPHTDYIRHVSLTFTLLSLALHILSLASILLARRRELAASGLAYGVAAGLGVLYGLINGYIYRAVGLDIGRFSYLVGRPNNEVVYRTLAGTITFEGIRLEQTLIHELVFKNAILLILLAAAIGASAAATALALGTAHKPTPAKGFKSQPIKIRQGLTYAAIFILLLPILASVFTYYPSSISARPQPPPATLEPPPYTYTLTGLVRTSRGALTYTDFEAYPVPGWTSYGGVWELSDGGGFRGNALRGRDNDGGVGGGSQYYWNTRIDGYSSLWVSLRTRAEGADGFKGIGLLNADRNRLYEISVQSTATIYKWDGAWRLLGSTSVPGYSATRWYTLVLLYNDRGTAVDFNLWIYDDTGTLVASLTASDTGGTRFRPAYAGITIDADTARWFRFEDFIVSTVDPRRILFTGFYSGMRVEVWDNLGNLVNSTTAPAASFPLGVTRDIVVGTGVDGRIILRYPDAYIGGVLSLPTTDAILGGDSYRLVNQTMYISLGWNRTSSTGVIQISSSAAFTTTTRFLRIAAAQTLYARLILDNISAPSTLNLDLWIEGAAKSTNITIRSGTPISTSTNIVPLNLGGGNHLALSGYFTATGQLASITLKLELYTAPGGMGACVRYPLFFILSSSSPTSAALDFTQGGEAQIELGWEQLPHQEEPAHGGEEADIEGATPGRNEETMKEPPFEAAKWQESTETSSDKEG